MAPQSWKDPKSALTIRPFVLLLDFLVTDLSTVINYTLCQGLKKCIQSDRRQRAPVAMLLSQTGSALIMSFLSGSL